MFMKGYTVDFCQQMKIQKFSKNQPIYHLNMLNAILNHYEYNITP